MQLELAEPNRVEHGWLVSAYLGYFRKFGGILDLNERLGRPTGTLALWFTWLDISKASLSRVLKGQRSYHDSLLLSI